MMSGIPESLIEEQVKLERSQVSQGLKCLNDNTFKLEDKSYASATVYGIASIDSLLPLLVNKINETNRRIHQGHTGVAFKEIHKYLAGLEPLAAAAIACKITSIKCLASRKVVTSLSMCVTLLVMLLKMSV